MKVNFSETRKRAEDEGLLGKGKYLKLAEGANRMRLMSECLEHPGEYQGTPTFKWLCYMLDRKDGKIKPFFMANKIYKQIEALQLDPDYAFDEVPMPYDITINAVGAGKTEVVYTVIAARNNTPLTEAELTALREIQPLRELQKAVYEASENPNGGQSDSQNAPLPPEPPMPARHATVPPEFLPSTTGGGVRDLGNVGTAPR